MTAKFESLPEWLSALIETTDKETAELEWLTPAEIISQANDDSRELFEAALPTLTEAQEEWAEELAPRMIKVAAAREGKFSVKTSYGEFCQPTFWLDLAEPDQLLCALNKHYPQFLWFPVGSTLASIEEKLAVYFAPRLPIVESVIDKPMIEMVAIAGQRYKRPQLPAEWSTERRLFGLVESVDGLAEIENHFTFANGFCTPLTTQGTSWEFSGEPILITALYTLHTNAEVRLEHNEWLHLPSGNPVAVQITYPRADHAELVAAINDRFNIDLPLDTPIDLIALLLRFPIKDLTRTRRAISESTEAYELIDYLGILTVVENSPERVYQDLRPFIDADNRDLREAIAVMANLHRLDSLLQEMMMIETDESIRSLISDLLAPE